MPWSSGQLCSSPLNRISQTDRAAGIRLQLWPSRGRGYVLLTIRVLSHRPHMPAQAVMAEMAASQLSNSMSWELARGSRLLRNVFAPAGEPGAVHGALDQFKLEKPKLAASLQATRVS